MIGSNLGPDTPGRRRRLPVLLSLAAVTAARCSSVALLPPTTRPGEASNVAVLGATAYVAMGESGLGVLDVPTGRMIRVLTPPRPAGSVDDVSVADGLLFALDARKPGYLAVFSIAQPTAPALRSGPLPVPVEPFAGVSAGGGRVVVSGGTSALTVASYDTSGRLLPDRVELDLGRGQPDVLLSPDGGVAYVSTHFSLLNRSYGLTLLRLSAPPGASAPMATLELTGAGFTPGASKPANFALETALAKGVLLAAFGDGLAVVDVSDPRRPRLLQVVKLPVRPVNVDVLGAHAAVVGSDPDPTLILLSLSDPRTPRVERVVKLPARSRPLGVAMSETRVVVAAKNGPMVVDR